MEVKRTERGWAGHFIAADSCRFRRNTLLEYGNRRWVVSTVGNCHVAHGDLMPIGYDRYYETMAFEAEDRNGYIEADVSKQLEFDSPCAIYGCDPDDLFERYGENIDNTANNMHESVVAELTEAIRKE